MEQQKALYPSVFHLINSINERGGTSNYHKNESIIGKCSRLANNKYIATLNINDYPAVVRNMLTSPESLLSFSELLSTTITLLGENVNKLLYGKKRYTQSPLYLQIVGDSELSVLVTQEQIYKTFETESKAKLKLNRFKDQ